MLPITGVLASVMQQKVQCLSMCWKISRTDGVDIRLTDHNAKLIVINEVYTPFGLARPSALERLANLKERSQDIMGALTSDEITELDLARGLYDDATVTQMLVDWTRPSAGPIYSTSFFITGLEHDQEVWQASLSGISSKLMKPVGRICNRLCDADVYDARCGLDPTDFDIDGEVTIVTGDFAVFTTDTSEDDGVLDDGEITWTSGDNTGFKSEIDRQVGGVLTLFKAPPYTVQVGDTFQALPGCDKTLPTCISKFNNAVNHRGFAQLVGNDRLLFAV